MPTIIDSHYRDHKELVSYLSDQKEESFKADVSREYSKVLILASASYFEDKISNLILDFCSSQTGENELITEFVRRKGLARQYHTLFSWKENNANTFFSLFGDEFKESHLKDRKKNDDLVQSIRNFMYIGRTRNILVHSNFITAPIDKTPNEIYEIFTSANEFIVYLENIFKVE